MTWKPGNQPACQYSRLVLNLRCRLLHSALDHWTNKRAYFFFKTFLTSRGNGERDALECEHSSASNVARVVNLLYRHKEQRVTYCLAIGLLFHHNICRRILYQHHGILMYRCWSWSTAWCFENAGRWSTFKAFAACQPTLLKCRYSMNDILRHESGHKF